MKNFIVLSEKAWHEDLYEKLAGKIAGNWHLINRKDDFTFDKLLDINPEKIFIPHWSYIIPEIIYSNFECIVFHMTDLPFGRGGSPLQNLIVRGISETKISALKVEEGIDEGPIYFKRPLNLNGTAQEILLRATDVIFKMIEEISNKETLPVPQNGEALLFKRRKPSDGDISELENLNELYDYIRMLDAEGYPKSFLEFGKFRIEFSRASLKSKKELIADVRIFQK